MDKDKGLNLEGFSKDFELIEEKIGESIIG